MVGVVAGELSPLMTGLVYCSVIEGCREVYALGRAREWTAALGRWCDEQPEMVAFVGVCQVHRAEILQLNGAWSDALGEAQRACERCLGINRQAAAAAYYQQGEIYRLRGEFAAAEAAYRDASRWGWDPHPGLALLRLAQGQTSAAAAAIRRALGEATAPSSRIDLLAAQVEILLATGDTGEARQACRELQEIAAGLDARVLGAIAGQALGAVELAEGNAQVAAGLLRRAWQVWQELDAPYPAARVRVLLGECCRALGDQEGAELERQAARTVFESSARRPIWPASKRPSREAGGPPAPAEPARAGGPAPGGHRKEQPGHRAHAVPQRAHRRAAREQHLPEAGRPLPRRRHRPRLPARAGLTGASAVPADAGGKHPRLPGRQIGWFLRRAAAPGCLRLGREEGGQP